MKELKATKVLKNILNIADYGRYMEEQEIIKEAIKELEELNNRSCIKCNTYYMKCKTFNTYWKKSESSLIIDASTFYCSEFEAKGE